MAVKHRNQLSILQYNTRKSRTVMVELFDNEKIYDIDIVAIQEPWRNTSTNTSYHPLKDRFNLIYPYHNNTRVCFYINKRISPERWYPSYHSPDLCTLNIKFGKDRVIYIHNIYIPGDQQTDGLNALHEALTKVKDEEQIMLGDFNLHHTMWGGPDANIDERSDELIFIAEEFAMEQALPEGTTTYEENCQTTIDLLFATPTLTTNIINCNTENAFDSGSDHLPILTKLELAMVESTPTARRNFNKLNSDILREILAKTMATKQYLTDLPEDHKELTNQDIDCQVTAIIDSIQTAINESTPVTRMSPRSKPGFTPECKEAQRRCKTLKRRWRRDLSEEAWNEYKIAKNFKNNLIKRTIRRTFRKFVAEACESPQMMWKKTKWARKQITTQACLPPLYDTNKREYNEPGPKADLLMRTFFPTPVQAELDDITSDTVYPQAPTMGHITENEIRRAITQAPSKKAPGGDAIPNLILKEVLELILPHLHRIFNACMTNGYCPDHFRTSVTVVLPKPGKDHSVPKGYRPIALLNTIGKAMEFILARRIAYLAETHNLLPITHMGGRRLRSCEHGIHYLLERIYQAWNSDKVATLLLLDVSGAYDKVSHPRLLHNLRKRSIDTNIVSWVDSFLSNRTTILKTSEHSTSRTPIATGIPQGSPLSPILYLFYNSDLIEDCNARDDLNTVATGFVDDVGLLTVGDSTEENCSALRMIHDEICLKWASRHGSEFDPSKYQLLHLSRKQRFNLDHSLQLNERQCINARQFVRYLGVDIDSKLSWNQHVKGTRSKVTKSIGALARIAGSTWGGNYKSMRQLYQAMVIPQLTYCCSVWHQPERTTGHNKTHLTSLQRIQTQAARQITGAFKATSTPALDIEAHLLPIKQQLDKITSEAVLRIATSPVYGEIIKPRFEKWKSKRKLKKKRKTSPLERHTNRFIERYGDINQIEKLQPFSAAPNWKPPKTIIHKTKEAAKKLVAKTVDEGHVMIYTDGSGINNKVGAAAVSSDINSTFCVYLGPSDRYTVYSAELHGILQALTMAAVHQPRMQFNTIIINTDNQASIQAIGDPGKHSGQVYVIQAVRTIDALRELGVTIELHWIPAHIDIPGNEWADNEAKKATGWREREVHGKRTAGVDTNDTAPNSVIQMRMISTVKTAIRAHATEQWTIDWANEKRGGILREIQSTPSKQIQLLHSRVKRAKTSLITQMRTEKIGLKAFLYSRWVPGIEKETCECGAKQTARHILHECKLFSKKRRMWWAEERRKVERGVITHKDMLTKPRYASMAADFMRSTGLIGQYQALEKDQQQGFNRVCGQKEGHGRDEEASA